MIQVGNDDTFREKEEWLMKGIFTEGWQGEGMAEEASEAVLPPAPGIMREGEVTGTQWEM